MPDRLPYSQRINDIPAYSCTEASRFLEIPVSTVRAWIRGQPYRTKTGEHLFARVIIPADETTGYLSFGNMVELFVLKCLRRTHEVPLPRIRDAIERIRGTFHSQHPLADLELLTDRRDVFIERFGEYLNLSRSGQIEMKRELEHCLKRIERESGIPRKLFPGKTMKIAIDPRVNFGRPTLVGAGIPTEVIWERNSSGEDVDFLAGDYQCAPSLIREAIEYEADTRAVRAA